MTQYNCFSIPVHEQYDVVVNQVENIGWFLPNSYIVLHVSAIAPELRRQLEQKYGKSETVFINPDSSPTAWGWIFHTHLSNYLLAERLALSFSYFIVDCSNALFFKRGAEEYFREYDFCATSYPFKVLGESHWAARVTKEHDPGFQRMIADLQAEPAHGRHEGSVFGRDLFREMIPIILRYYSFHIEEHRYPREEVFMQTLARHMSSNFSGPITGTMETTPELLTAIRNEDLDYCRSYPEWVGSDIDLDLLRRLYATKPVPRDMGDPLRQFIINLQ